MESGIDNVIDDNMEDKGIWITNNARDEILEQDNPEALKQRYDAIYDLWKFRHSDFAKADPERPFWERFNPWRKKESPEQREERMRKSVHSFLDTMVKAYSTNHTSFDFDHILQGFETQDDSSDHLSDIVYSRFVDFHRMDKNKVKIAVKEGAVEYDNGRLVYSVSPTKVEMRAARPDQTIEISWADAFRMADDALANGKNLPPNTMYLRGSEANRAKLEAALHIRTESWSADRKPKIEGSIGVFSPGKIFALGGRGKSDPYGVLDEARDFIREAKKNGTPLYPPGLGNNFAPLHEMISNNWEERQAQNIPSSNPELEAKLEDMLAVSNPDIEADAHMREYAAFKANQEQITAEPTVEESEAHVNNAIETLDRAADDIETSLTPSEPAMENEETTDPVAATVSASENALETRRDQLGPYEEIGETVGGEKIFAFRQPVDPNGSDADAMEEFFFTDDGNNVRIVKLVHAGNVFYADSDPDMQFVSYEDMIRKYEEETNQSLKEINPDLLEAYNWQGDFVDGATEDTKTSQHEAGTSSPVVWYHPKGQPKDVQQDAANDVIDSGDINGIIAEQGRRMMDEINASGPVTHIGDDATYRQIVDIIVRRPEIFHDRKKRHLDKLLDTVNSAAHQDNPYQAPLVMDNALLAARLEADGLIQTREYHERGKAYRGVAKVASYDNFVPVYENDRLTYKEDPVYKALTQDILNAPGEWKGKSYADIAARVTHYREELKWTRMMEEKDMTKKFWSDLKTSGIIAVSNNTLKAEITNVADSLLNTTRFGSLRREFNKASGFTSPERALELQAQREAEREAEAKEKEKENRKKRTPLAEQMVQAANVPVALPLVRHQQGPYAMGDFPSAAMK